MKMERKETLKRGAERGRKWGGRKRPKVGSGEENLECRKVVRMA